MRDVYKVAERQRVPGKKSPYWGVLTLDNLPKTNGNHRQLIVQRKAFDRVAKVLGDIQPKSKLEDFSI